MATYSSNSPCAACKFLRRKCTQRCVFAPYFPPDQPAKFAAVHRIFGASNVAKLLSELTSEQREDAVSSLAYEAEARLRDPVYGCVGYISVLQRRLKQLQEDLFRANKELSSYYAAARQSLLQTNQYNHGLHPELVASSSSSSSLQTEMLRRELWFEGFNHTREIDRESWVLLEEHPFRRGHLAGENVNSGAGHAPPQ